jgi:hypothetical protein
VIHQHVFRCIKSHASYSSYEKCTDRYVLGRVILNSISEPRGSVESFLRQLDEDHHLTISPLTELPSGLATNFPIDYMYCVCSGVMRKLVNVWISGPLQVRLELNKFLPWWKPYILVEFNTKCRSLSEISRWIFKTLPRICYTLTNLISQYTIKAASRVQTVSGSCGGHPLPPVYYTFLLKCY